MNFSSHKWKIKISKLKYIWIDLIEHPAFHFTVQDIVKRSSKALNITLIWRCSRVFVLIEFVVEKIEHWEKVTRRLANSGNAESIEPVIWVVHVVIANKGTIQWWRRLTFWIERGFKNLLAELIFNALMGKIST